MAEKSWIVICVRKHQSKTVGIPLMSEDDTAVELFDYDFTRKICETYPLCQASENLLVNLETGEVEWH